jgi:hypothetical protein
VFWQGKPIDPGFVLNDYNGMKGVALTCSIVAEFYLAYGYLGCVLGGLFCGKVASWLAQLAGPDMGVGALVMFGSGLLAIFSGMRSSIELVLMSYAVLAWVALVWMYTCFVPSALNAHGRRQ